MLSESTGDPQGEPIAHIASGHGIPLYDVRRPLGNEFAKAIRQFAPDLIVASCFPSRIPRNILDEAKHGGVNLHPSLLPLHRGPDPLFWTFHAGERVTGSTVHELGDKFDDGAILGQSQVEIADRLPGDRLEALLADLGANLLVDVVERVGADRTSRRTQDDTKATYQSWPSEHELEINRNWSVQHTLNFVAGVIPLGYEPWVTTERGSVLVSDACRVESVSEAVVESWLDNKSVRIAVADGIVELKIRE